MSERPFMGRVSAWSTVARRVHRAMGRAALCAGLVVVGTQPSSGPFGATGTGGTRAAAGLRFEISFPATVSREARTGHIILVVSKDTSAEPRLQYRVYSPDVQPGFGLDVDNLAPGATAVIDGSVFG